MDDENCMFWEIRQFPVSVHGRDSKRGIIFTNNSTKNGRKQSTEDGVVTGGVRCHW